jgi:hypothetical protein
MLVTGFMANTRGNAQTPHHVYIILWFDTEDYILPQSDDAAKRVADMLTGLGVRATFKVVGEKARTLERRGRTDVIAALKRHEIGYHSNTHSQHPTPAEYEEPLSWDEGVREFTRRERGGFEDVARVFGQKPACYGQPGSSWSPQSFGALHSWGVNVYLDEAGQVGLNGKPFWFGGLLNIFNTREGGRIRANETWSNLEDAKQQFAGFYKSMSSTGGIVSIFFHPCEFIHAQFWDGVNFAHGANPPREEWKLPPMKSPEEQERSYRYLADMVRFLKAYPLVRFITASEALKLYRDRARDHTFTREELSNIAKTVGIDIGFQEHGDLTLSPADIFALLNRFVSAGGQDSALKLPASPIYGPAAASESGASGNVPWSQFARTAMDVQSYLDSHRQIPSTVWLGSVPVSPEGYLSALAKVAGTMLKSGPPLTVAFPPAKLVTMQFVAEDKPSLWNWVIFPDGFHAPNLMALARLQAWTLKPAVLHE